MPDDTDEEQQALKMFMVEVQKNNPSTPTDVEGLLASYRGQEDQLTNRMIARCKIDPDAMNRYFAQLRLIDKKKHEEMLRAKRMACRNRTSRRPEARALQSRSECRG